MSDQPRTVWGVDPGITGAVCALTRHEGKYLYEYVRVPVNKVLRPGRSAQNVPDVQEFTQLMYDLNRRYPPSRIVIEKVGALPKQGVVSMFRFGWVAGMMEGVIRAVTHGRRRSIMWTYLYPHSWKRVYGLTDSSATATKRSRKQCSIETANRLIAEMDIQGLPFVSVTSDADAAEAFLLACSGFYNLNKRLIEYGKEHREENILQIVDIEHENDLIPVG